MELITSTLPDEITQPNPAGDPDSPIHGSGLGMAGTSKLAFTKPVALEPKVPMPTIANVRMRRFFMLSEVLIRSFPWVLRPVSPYFRAFISGIPTLSTVPLRFSIS